MKRSGYFITLVLAVVLSLCFADAQCWAGEKVYKMTGDITALGPDHNTVVIEVPVGEKLFTVAGPVSPEAVLKKHGRSVDLIDFQIGERVTVKWKATETGHLILSVRAKR